MCVVLLIILASLVSQNVVGDTIASCEDIDPVACQSMAQQNANMCQDPTLARQVCPKHCNKCPLVCYSGETSIDPRTNVIDFRQSNTISCNTGEICRLKPHGTGIGSYIAECGDQQHCTHYDICCNSSLCNTPKALTTLPPTTTTTTTTPKPTTTTVKQEKLSCPNNVLHDTNGNHNKAFVDENNRKCFHLVTTHQTWFTAESVCRKNGGHLAAIKSQTQNALLHTFAHAYGHKVWIGLIDPMYENHYKWSSGAPMTYTNWFVFDHHVSIAHLYGNCMVMGPNTGRWAAANCFEYNAYFCEYAAVYLHGSSLQTTSIFTDGNIDFCHRDNIQHSTSHPGHFLGQYGKSCYEIITSRKVSFDQGEQICQHHGGHLAYITNSQEQSFIELLMNRHYPDHAVWIGLTDYRREWHFKWTSGNPVTYTNWKPGHESNFYDHQYEDCVVFIPYEDGKWDDIPCGHTYHGHEEHQSCSGSCYGILCQYET